MSTIGISIGIPQNGASGGAASFDPAILFENSEVGVWYDPSDLSTMFQDTAGTSPITADGQTVARINDKSVNGVDATQATAGSRPTYRTDGTLHWLEFDGSADHLVTGSVNFNTASSDWVTVFAGLRKDSDAATGMFVELGAISGLQTASFNLTAPNGTGYGFRSAGSGGPVDTVPTGFPAPETAVLTGLGHISGDICKLRRNGVQVGSNGSNQLSGNYRDDAIYIGSRAGTGVYFNGNLYSLIVRGKTTGDVPLAGAEEYVAGKTGVAL